MRLLPYLIENTGVCEEERLVRFSPYLVENTGVCEEAGEEGGGGVLSGGDSRQSR